MRRRGRAAICAAVEVVRVGEVDDLLARPTVTLIEPIEMSQRPPQLPAVMRSQSGGLPLERDGAELLAEPLDDLVGDVDVEALVLCRRGSGTRTARSSGRSRSRIVPDSMILPSRRLGIATRGPRSRGPRRRGPRWRAPRLAGAWVAGGGVGGAAATGTRGGDHGDRAEHGKSSTQGHSLLLVSARPGHLPARRTAALWRDRVAPPPAAAGTRPRRAPGRPAPPPSASLEPAPGPATR